MRRAHLSPAPDTRHLAVFVVADRPQAGKSVVAAACAQILGTRWVNSSAVIAERVEERLGLERGAVAAARAINPEHYRGDLIAEGNAMAAAGRPPGVACVERGYRVIDGLRRAAELHDAMASAQARGLTPLVILVERPAGRPATDNTEGAALRAMADVVIVNDGTLAQLVSKVERTLRHAVAA